MCNLSRSLIEKGVKQGIESEKKNSLTTQMKSIKAIMEKYTLTLEEAMDAMQIAESEQMVFKSLFSKES